MNIDLLLEQLNTEIFWKASARKIIEKDKKPKWKHKDAVNVPVESIDFMLKSLNENELNLEEELS